MMNEDGKLIRIFPALTGRNLAVEDMDLEVSVRNALKRSGIHNLAQLLQLSHPELLQIFPNRKLRSYEDVIHRLVCLSEEPEGMDTAAPDFTCEENIGNTLGDIKMSNKKFNIFQVARIWKSEEIHTSVIAELINPQSAFHHKGASFLDKFLQRIGVEISGEELKHAEVKTEVPTDKGRRIDMVICTDSCYLPFEVKIWAHDQDKQLQDYYEFAKTQADKRKQTVPGVYYLTPNEHKPSEQSRSGLSNKQVHLLSFKKNILPWLEDCMKDPEVPPDVFEIMKQLHDNIEGPQSRPGIQGFSRWKRDVLDDIYWELSKEYNLPWTECTADYMTFTLNKKESFEFALRVKKERGGRVRLYLICGLTREDGKPDYATAGDYISKNADKFKELLDATFIKEDGLEIKSAKSAWDRLPEKVCYENANECCCGIKKIFEKLQPGSLIPAAARAIMAE